MDDQHFPKILKSLMALTGFRPPASTSKQKSPAPDSPLKIMANKRRSPEDNPTQTNFLDLVEDSPIKGKQERQPRRLPRRWSKDPEGFLEVMADPDKRAKAHKSDAGHDWTVLKGKLGIPTPAQKRDKLAHQAQIYAEVVGQLGIDITKGPLSAADLQRICEAMAQSGASLTDPTSSEGVTVYTSAKAMALRRAKDHHGE